MGFTAETVSTQRERGNRGWTQMDADRGAGMRRREWSDREIEKRADTRGAFPASYGEGRGRVRLGT
jgi:hypothetical protein